VSDGLGQILILEVGACIVCALYCGILSHVLDQPRAADTLATLIGALIIVIAIQ
jgi:hypothetical protein